MSRIGEWCVQKQNENVRFLGYYRTVRTDWGGILGDERGKIAHHLLHIHTLIQNGVLLRFPPPPKVNLAL
jgi:hypothetical protein